MSALINIIAGCKAQHFSLVEMPVLDVFNALNSCIGIRKVCVSDVSCELVVLSTIPFSVDQEC